MTIARREMTDEQVIEWLIEQIFRYCKTNVGRRFFNPIIVTRKCPSCSAIDAFYAYRAREVPVKTKDCWRCDEEVIPF